MPFCFFFSVPNLDKTQRERRRAAGLGVPSGFQGMRATQTCAALLACH